MKKNTKQLLAVLCIILSFLGIVACAAKPALNIRYNLPPSNRTLEGIKAGIDFVDKRSDIHLLDKAAKGQLADFTGKFTFQTDTDKKPEQSKLFDLSELFQQILRKRLESMGATVSQNPNETNVTLKLMLNTFKLNFIDGSWKAKIAYEAQLLTGDDIRAREEISGSGERIKIISTDGADKVLSELCTVVINQLNLEKMFHKAGVH